MRNVIKYDSANLQPDSIKSGNFNISTKLIPTNPSGFYNGISPIIGGYTIYVNKAENGPSIYAPKNDSELIDIVQKLGGSVSTAADALVWINSQSNMTVVNENYPDIVTSGLILNLDAGFVSSYPKTGTTWRDLSGNENNGTLINGVGFSGGSMVFDGVNDRVTIPDFNYGRQGCTVCAWVKYNASSKGYREGIVSKWQTGAGQSNEFMLTSNDLYETSPKYPIFTIYNTNNQAVSAIDLTTIMTVGTWYYLVGSFDGLNSKIYVNGVFKSSSPNSSSPTIKTLASQPIAIASFGDSFQYNTNCSILSTKMYNRALSDQEIRQNYYAGLQRFIPTDGLVLSLDAQNTNLYATSPTTAYDVSGNGNNGTLANGVGLVGDYEGSWSFDGVNDEIQLSTELQLDESWTLNYYQNVNITQDMLSLPSLFTIIPQNGTASPGHFGIGFGNFTDIRAIHIDNSNNIYVGGNFGGYNDTFRNPLIKINEDGSINNDFNIGSLNSGVWGVNKIQQLSNGTIVSASTNLGTGTGIVFNNPNTAQLITFTNDPGSRICTSFIIKESTNSIYVLDSWVSTYQNKSLAGKIFKLDLTSGNIDINFDSSTGFKSAVGKITVSATEGVNDGIVLQDGHLLCVGTFLEYKGIPTNRIVKINSNTAALDTSFNFGTGFNSTTTSAIQMNNGTIVVVGSFTTYNGVTKNSIVGLNNDGTINNEFKVGTGFNNTVNSIIYDSVNDKLFCFGLFTSYSGITANRIVKLNSDGTIDNSFNYGTGFNSTTFNGKLDNQGRLVVLGDPTLTYKNQSLPRRICRINPDGSLDSNFVSNGFNLDRYRQDTVPRLIDNTAPYLVGFFGINSNREVINQPNGAMDFNGAKYYTISFNHTTNQILTYINGVLRKTHNLNARLPFRGKIFRSYGNFSNLTVYNRALSQSEITTIYNATKSRYGIQ